jgi:hypothetical protein
VPGGADIRHQARGVTPTSDVTDWMKVKTNTGIAAAAGVVSGARLGRPGDVIDGEDAMGCSGSSSRQPILRSIIEKRRSEGAGLK